MNYTDLENLVREWLIYMSGKDVIWENTEGVRPKNTFISVYLQGVTTPHTDIMGLETDSSGLAVVIAHREAMFKVTVRGVSNDIAERSLNVAQNICDRVSFPSVQNWLDEKGLTISNITNATQYPNILSSADIEDDSYFEVTFRFGEDSKDDAGYFERVVMSGEVINENNVIDVPQFEVN